MSARMVGLLLSAVVDDVEPREAAHEAVAVGLAVRRQLDVGDRIRARSDRPVRSPSGGCAFRSRGRGGRSERGRPPGREVEARSRCVEAHDDFARLGCPGTRAGLPSVDRIEGPLAVFLSTAATRFPSGETRAHSGSLGRDRPRRPAARRARTRARMAGAEASPRSLLPSGNQAPFGTGNPCPGSSSTRPVRPEAGSGGPARPARPTSCRARGPARRSSRLRGGPRRVEPSVLRM